MAWARASYGRHSLLTRVGLRARARVRARVYCGSFDSVIFMIASSTTQLCAKERRVNNIDCVD